MAETETIFEVKYSSYWRLTDSLLYYKHPHFQYKRKVIITDLYNCLIVAISPNKLYNTKNIFTIEIFDEDYVNYLAKCDASICIVSNCFNQSKLTIDMTKRVVELFVERTNIPIMGLFALKPNCISKPFTGSWRLLNGFYKPNSIAEACVVSNQGGLIAEKESRNGNVESYVAYSDVDRCYAHNINIPYYSIDEFLIKETGDKTDPGYGKSFKYCWNHTVIGPEKRRVFCDAINQLPQLDIFGELLSLHQRVPKDSYVLMISGPPRCGKTRLAKMLLQQWNKHEFGINNAIKHISRNNFSKATMERMFKKCVDKRISVILDGSCDNKTLRKNYLNYIGDKNIGLLFIQINITEAMAMLFNNVFVEEANNDVAILYKPRDYILYRSTFEKITNMEIKKFCYLLYSPRIEERATVMKMRY